VASLFESIHFDQCNYLEQMWMGGDGQVRDRVVKFRYWDIHERVCDFCKGHRRSAQGYVMHPQETSTPLEVIPSDCSEFTS